MAETDAPNPPAARGSVDPADARTQNDFRKRLRPGAVVAVTQQMAFREKSWSDVVRGTVVSFEQKQTGSWYAHSKGDKLWLDRLVLKKADGEITTLVLDEYSHIDIESQGPAPQGPPSVTGTV